MRKALNGLRRVSLLFQNFLFRIITKKLGFKSAVVQHTETSVKMLVLVDDPLCISVQIPVGILFSTLGQCLTTKITEVIRPQPVVFLGTRLWNTPTRFKEMPNEGWHRIVRRLRKKRQIARRGPPEQRRARTDGQVKTQKVSSKKWAKCISHFPADQTHSVPPCVAQVNWRTRELQVCRCEESGQTDHVVVHSKNMKFQDGTRSKPSEHACWMDRLKLGWMS